MARARVIYAIYKGDEFIDVGTSSELSERMNIKKQTLLFLATPTSRKRNKGNRMIVIKFTEEDEAI